MLTFNIIRLMWRLKCTCDPTICALMTFFCVLRILLMTPPVELMDIRLPPFLLDLKLIDVVVVFLGVLVVIETFLASFTLCTSGLWVKLYNRENFTNVKSCSIYLLTVCSVTHVCWLFVLVRTVWVQHYGILIQILHVIPPMMLLVQVVIGDLFLLVNQQYNHLHITRKEYLTEKDIAMELKSHWKYCTPLVIYFLTMLYITCTCDLFSNQPTILQILIILTTFGSVLNHVYSAIVIHTIGDLIYNSWVDPQEESAPYDPGRSVLVNAVEDYSGEEYKEYLSNLCISNEFTNVFVAGHGPGSELVM